MTAFASTTQLANRVGQESFSGGNETRASAILEDTSAFIVSECGRDWTSGSVPADVVAVCLRVAQRTFNNPDMYVWQQAGGFSVRLPDQLATQIFTAGELLILRRHRTSKRGGLWTLETTRGDDVDGTGYLPVEGHYDPFPVYDESDYYNQYGDHYRGSRPY